LAAVPVLGQPCTAATQCLMARPPAWTRHSSHRLQLQCKLRRHGRVAASVFVKACGAAGKGVHLLAWLDHYQSYGIHDMPSSAACALHLSAWRSYPLDAVWQAWRGHGHLSAAGLQRTLHTIGCEWQGQAVVAPACGCLPACVAARSTLCGVSAMAVMTLHLRGGSYAAHDIIKMTGRADSYHQPIMRGHNQRTRRSA